MQDHCLGFFFFSWFPWFRCKGARTRKKSGPEFHVPRRWCQKLPPFDTFSKNWTKKLERGDKPIPDTGCRYQEASQKCVFSFRSLRSLSSATHPSNRQLRNRYRVAHLGFCEVYFVCQVVLLCLRTQSAPHKSKGCVCLLNDLSFYRYSFLWTSLIDHWCCCWKTYRSHRVFRVLPFVVGCFPIIYIYIYFSLQLNMAVRGWFGWVSSNSSVSSWSQRKKNQISDFAITHAHLFDRYFSIKSQGVQKMGVSFAVCL